MDFSLACTQANVARDDLYMKIPKGVELDGNKSECVLHVNKSLYGMRQAGQVLNKHLVKCMLNIGSINPPLMNVCSTMRNQSSQSTPMTPY